MHTLVLNADFTYINTVPWQKAIKLLVKEKAQVLKESSRKVSNAEGTCVFKIPVVLKLVQLVSVVYKNKVPYSRKNIFIRDNHTCLYCGTHKNLSIDHVIPSSQGGKTCFENCVTSCVSCNLKKGNRTPQEANMRLKKPPHEPTIIEFLTHKMKNTGAYSFLKEIKIYT